MSLDPSFEPQPKKKGSYYRRLEDIPRALDKLEVTGLNSAAQFITYYIAVEKLAKAIVGINANESADAAFARPVDLRKTKRAARDMKLNISAPELTVLFKPDKKQQHGAPLPPPTSAVAIRNRLFHDFGPTQVSHVRKHAPGMVPIMVRFIDDDIGPVLKHLRTLWTASQTRL